MTTEIRRAGLHEAMALTKLSLRAKQSNGYDDAFMDACRAELTVTAASMAEGEYWAAYQADVICGCMCITEDKQSRDGEIHAFFIDPDRQRQGIGKLLWEKAVERAHAKGLVKLHLDADPFAVPFYQAMGFEIVGETPSGSIKERMIPYMEMQLASDNV